MSFLVTPTRFDIESERGYLHRLATANGLSFEIVRDLVQSATVTAPGGFETHPGGGRQSILALAESRHCPKCLAEAPLWRREWSVPFLDACCRHEVWLVDVCSRCGENPEWTRPELLRCQCGQNLAAQPTCEAPSALVAMSRDLQSLQRADAAKALAPLRQLNLDQALKLIRLLGVYGTSQGVPHQKVQRIDRISVSWSLSSYAAEILANWEAGFPVFLNSVRKQSEERIDRSLPRAFRGLYVAIYRGLTDPEFDFVRNAFAAYVHHNWKGLVAKRNRRLPLREGDKPWISLAQAARKTGIGGKRLSAMIDAGALDACVVRSQTGRLMRTVRTDSLATVEVKQGCCTLKSAAARLGLKKARLAKILGPLTLLQQKRDPYSREWHVNADLVARLELVVAKAPEFDLFDPSLTTLDKVLRYAALPDAQICRLVYGVAEGQIKVEGRLTSLRGIPSLLVSRAEIHGLHDACDRRSEQGMSIPQVARQLHVKQEVAYFLAREKFLGCTRINGTRRAELRVSQGQLLSFKEKYVFARDLAISHGTSPRHIMHRLAAVGCYPCSGPGVDRGRQALFVRSTIQSADMFPEDQSNVVTTFDSAKSWDCPSS